MSFIAFGKIAGTWHAVAHGADSPRLISLGARRRRIFTPAELAPAARFKTREIAQAAGHLLGIRRVYATPAPHLPIPPAAELAVRPIVARSEPSTAAEAAELDRYIKANQADHAALLQLSTERLAQQAMLAAMRRKRSLRSIPSVTSAAELPLSDS